MSKPKIVTVVSVEDEGWRVVLWVRDEAGHQYWRTGKEVDVPHRVGQRGMMQFRQVTPFVSAA